MAGFGIDVINTVGSGGQVASVGNLRVEAWAHDAAISGSIVGTDVLGVSGGQIVNLINPVVTDFDLSNPIRLFRFDFSTASAPIEHVAFVPMNPNPNGGLAFYPQWQDGAMITAPNGAGADLTLTGWEYIVPAPGGAGALGAGLLVIRRRRR